MHIMSGAVMKPCTRSLRRVMSRRSAPSLHADVHRRSTPGTRARKHAAPDFDDIRPQRGFDGHAVRARYWSRQVEEQKYIR